MGNPTRIGLETLISSMNQTKYTIACNNLNAAYFSIAVSLNDTDEVMVLSQNEDFYLRILKVFETQNKGTTVAHAVGKESITEQIKMVIVQATQIVKDADGTYAEQEANIEYIYKICRDKGITVAVDNSNTYHYHSKHYNQ